MAIGGARLPAQSSGTIAVPQSDWLPGFWSAGSRAAALEHCTALISAFDPDGAPDQAQLAKSVYVLNHALRNDGPDTAILELLADLTLLQGDSAGAASLLLDADIRQGGSKTVRRKLIDLLEQRGDRASARRLARAWLLDQPKIAQYWWHFAALADSRSDYATLQGLPDYTLSTEALTENLTLTRKRALARIALQVGLEDDATARYRDLVTSDLAKLTAQGAAATRIKPPGKDDPYAFKAAASDPHVVSFVDPLAKTRAQFWQAIHETLRRGDWIGLTAVLQSRRFEDPADTDTLRSLRQIAQFQVLWASPMPHQGYAGLLKAHFLMRQHKIAYWLDSGALLGAVRESGDISWDSDIDLGVWNDAVPQIMALANTFAAQGIKCSPRSYRGHVYGFTIKLPKIKTIHIHVYFRHGDQSVSPQMMCLYHPASPEAEAPFARHKWTWYLMYRIRASGLSYKLGPRPVRFIRRHLIRRSWHYLMAIRNRLPREKWQRVYPFSAMFAIGTWAVPSRFFDEITTMRIGGVKLNLPADHDGYLTARYGNWRVAQQDWCYWTDDGCITPKTPEECGFVGLFDKPPTPPIGQNLPTKS